MKRKLTLLLVLCILLSFTACGAEEESTPTFYYLRIRDFIQYGSADALIAPVAQELSQDSNPEELLQRYLTGPAEEKYCSPIPKGTYLLSILYREDTLVLVLSREFSTLDGIQLSLAEACLAATCHSLTGYTHFQVRSGESVYEFTLNDFVFLDRVSGD